MPKLSETIQVVMGKENILRYNGNDSILLGLWEKLNFAARNILKRHI